MSSSSNIVKADSSMDSDFIASIFGPLSSMSALGNRSFSKGDASASHPTKSKHYVWKCLIDSPAVEFPMKTASLIDNGAHIVLIRPDLVTELGLPLSLLERPEIVNVALDSPTDKSKKTLTHLVNFQLTLLDGVFASWKVSAFVAPGLCMPIILGFPFLEKNKVVCDHKLCTCVHKPSGYNLLNSMARKPWPLPKPHLCKQIRETKNDKRVILHELIDVVITKCLP